MLSALSVGLGKGDCGYENLRSLWVGKNELGKQFTTALKHLLWSERAPCMLQELDVSCNELLDGYEMAIALKRNDSLTSIDFRGIPNANSADIYSFIGTFLLQEECQCRLGFLSCDAFQVVPGQTALVLDEVPESEAAKEAKEPPPGSAQAKLPPKVNPTILLLAGVVKFNSSLSRLTLVNTGLNRPAASSFATALLENKALEHLDLSQNPIGAEGVAEIAHAVRTHPSLTSIKIDGTPLPIVQLLGSKPSDTGLDLTDWSLGPLSGNAIGILLLSNRVLLNLNLKFNALGANGVTATVEGCGDAPLKAIDLTRTGLGGETEPVLESLSVSICRHLGLLVELRMDENELACNASALAPLCKLRNLRTLSLEKNRLFEVPALLGTMLSLRRVLLHSNQLIELPPSICLLASLEVLDVHKNLITTLPSALGKLTSLQKMDLSENKLTELPVSVCELNEALQLSCGRNPLEKPSIEQARQGIGAIRRYFGYSARKGQGDDAADGAAEAGKSAPPETPFGREAKRPLRKEGEPSRHDWAGPGILSLLFNCFDCSFSFLDSGAAEPPTVPADESFELIVSFNLQCVGKVREGKSTSEPFADRVDLHNEWLPWRVQEDVGLGDTGLLAVSLKARNGKTHPGTLLMRPWLAYGCSIGSRVKMGSSYATVVELRKDDSCEVVHDNALDLAERQVVDPRPDTIGRTSSPAYKGGQKLLLLHEGQLVDAVVEECLGVRRGSRHRVRLSAKPDAAKVEGVTAGGKPKGEKAAKPKVKESLEVDLNDTNHAKLLFPTGARYEDARQQYLEKLSLRHATFKDEALARELPVEDQRVYVRPVSHCYVCMRMQCVCMYVSQPRAFLYASRASVSSCDW